jgi:bifunctional non-homologous end joining protein LigD
VSAHASFLGLRGDKNGEEVVAETPQPVPDAEADDRQDQQPDRVIYPEARSPRATLADYYRAVAPIMLPWAATAAISLVRCPQGRARNASSRSMTPARFGPHVHTFRSARRKAESRTISIVEDATASRLRPDGDDRIPRLGRAGRRCREARSAGVRLDPDEGLGFDEVRRPRATASANSPTSACRLADADRRQGRARRSCR